MSTKDPLFRYNIIKEIGSGGMATVFLAYDKVLGREVALKMMHQHLLDQSDSVRRFTNEAKAIAALPHEHIIKIFDYGEIESRPFLVMEYIEGTTLQELIQKHGTLPDLVTIEITRQIASGLLCAHQNGFFHRDIKPANILIGKNGDVRITDFGIAYIVNSQSITMTGTFLGSPHYISPEQAQGKQLKGTTDIFSLGVILYQCITGKVPFDAESPHAVIYSIINNKQEDIRKKKDTILLWLTDMVERCLLKDPELRPDSQKVLSHIDEICKSDSLNLGKRRITSFIDSPDQYRETELKELFEIYRSAALDELRSKRIASGLRKLEQAKLFGKLSAEDLKLKAVASRNSQLRKFTLATLVTLCLSALVPIYLHNKPKPISEPSSPPDIALLPSSISQVTSPTPNLPGSPDSLTNTISDQLLSVPPEEQKGEPDIKKTVTATKATIVKNDTSLAKKPGLLNIFTNPPWVTIYIDGIERGMTPRTNYIRLPPGIHELVLYKTGFTEYKKPFTITSSDTLTMRIRLQVNNRELSQNE